MATNPLIISRRQDVGTPYPLSGVSGRILARLSREFGAWLYVAIVLVLVSALAFAYLAEASYVATQIDRMAMLEQKLDDLHEDNSALLLGIAEMESMARIKTEARALGLGEATRIEYVVVVLDDPAPATTTPAGSGLFRPSVAHMGNDVVAPQGTRLVSVIAQQFQSWIGGAGSATGGTRN